MDENSSQKEIEDALRQFETVSIQRQQEKIKQNPIVSSNDTPKMVEKTIKYSGGLIKNQRQAEYLLLALVISMFGLSLYFFFGGDNGVQENDTSSGVGDLQTIP